MDYSKELKNRVSMSECDDSLKRIKRVFIILVILNGELFMPEK